jgi:hypothetical protein
MATTTPQTNGPAGELSDPTFDPAGLLPAGECGTCDVFRLTQPPLYPAHHPSPRCRCGSGAHCSCDACF